MPITKAGTRGRNVEATDVAAGRARAGAVPEIDPVSNGPEASDAVPAGRAIADVPARKGPASAGKSRDPNVSRLRCRN